MFSRSSLPRSRWNAAFIAEISVCTLLLAGSLAAALSLGIYNTRAVYQYDNRESHETAVPFVMEGEGDSFTVNVTFSLNALHASTFVIGGDDCLEEMMVNGEAVRNVAGLCNLHPGHAIHLPGLNVGENTLSARVRDTGGKGGFMMRTSWLDPLLLTLVLFMAALFSWVGARLILLRKNVAEAAFLPAIIALAFLIRLSLSWHGGFGGDIHLNQEWSRSAVQLGMVQSYNEQVNPEVMLPNYPPLNILMFATAGYFYKYTISPDFDPDGPMFRIIIKLPAIFADLITVVVLFFVLLPMAGRRKALFASLLYAVHPAVFHDSSIWGQTDSVFTLFMCLSLLSAQRHRWLLAGMAVTAALLFKMQAIIILPVLAVIAGLYWRRWLLMIAGGAIVTVPVMIPFIAKGMLQKFVDIFINSVGYYSSLSSNAYNLWVMLYSKDTGKSATDLFLNVMEHRTAGLILWGIVIVSVTVGWMRSIAHDIETKGKTGVVFLSAALIAYSFFLFNAEMHERYLFAYMALGLPLVLTGRKGILLYLSASFLFLLNLVSLVAFSDFDRVLVQETFGKSHPVAIATAHMIVFFLTWQHLHAYQKSTISGKKRALFAFIRSLNPFASDKSTYKKLLQRSILR